MSKRTDSVSPQIKVLTAAVLGLVALWAFLGAPNPYEGGKTVDENLVAQAKEAVGQLRVAQPERQSEYARARFGESWEDVDGNGCYTRNDVLARDLEDVRYRPGSDCVVVSGVLDDPYSGERFDFDKSNPDYIQIDHVVALAEAWRSGAWAWDDDQRLVFANDPLNLLAVSGQTNDDKASSDAAGWLPPNKDFRCDYVARQVVVKKKYDLSVDTKELGVITRLLDGCETPGK